MPLFGNFFKQLQSYLQTLSKARSKQQKPEVYGPHPEPYGPPTLEDYIALRTPGKGDILGPGPRGPKPPQDVVFPGLRQKHPAITVGPSTEVFGPGWDDPGTLPSAKDPDTRQPAWMQYVNFGGNASQDPGMPQPEGPQPPTKRESANHQHITEARKRIEEARQILKKGLPDLQNPSTNPIEAALASIAMQRIRTPGTLARVSGIPVGMAAQRADHGNKLALAQHEAQMNAANAIIDSDTKLIGAYMDRDTALDQIEGQMKDAETQGKVTAEIGNIRDNHSLVREIAKLADGGNDIAPGIAKFYRDKGYSAADADKLTSSVLRQLQGNEGFQRQVDHEMTRVSHEKIGLADIENAQKDWNNPNISHEQRVAHMRVLQRAKDEGFVAMSIEAMEALSEKIGRRAKFGPNQSKTTYGLSDAGQKEMARLSADPRFKDVNWDEITGMMRAYGDSGHATAAQAFANLEEGRRRLGQVIATAKAGGQKGNWQDWRNYTASVKSGLGVVRARAKELKEELTALKGQLRVESVVDPAAWKDPNTAAGRIALRMQELNFLLNGGVDATGKEVRGLYSQQKELEDAIGDLPEAEEFIEKYMEPRSTEARQAEKNAPRDRPSNKQPSGRMGNVSPEIASIRDDVKRLFGITAGSGYRNPQRNKEVGGSTTSRHMDGEAIDLPTTDIRKGNAIVDWALAEGRKRGLRQIIWRDQNWRWNRLANRGKGAWERHKPIADHYDHVHLGR